jgi:cell division transport system permease protein
VALSTTYVARETAGNLRRNLVMTVAAMVTMTVSLSVLGVVLIVRQAANKATEQWRGGVEMAIFLQPTVSTNESNAIDRELSANPGVKTFHFVDKQQAYQEFKTIFGGNSEIVSSLGPNDMPPSYRVVPTQAQDIQDLGKQFQNQPGVLQVSYAAQAIKSLLNRSNQIKVGGQVLAALVMLAAVALIVNTIQLAIFARRREVAVMKLVGATNWFIRVPFMLEGLVQGLVGAALAFGLIYAIRNPVASFVGNESMLGIQTLYVSPQEAVLTGILLLVVGAAVGMIGSAFAVRRFLSV